jgi:hypothetical protein
LNLKSHHSEAAKADHQTVIVNASIGFQGLANPSGCGRRKMEIRIDRPYLR